MLKVKVVGGLFDSIDLPEGDTGAFLWHLKTHKWKFMMNFIPMHWYMGIVWLSCLNGREEFTSHKILSALTRYVHKTTCGNKITYAMLRNLLLIKACQWVHLEFHYHWFNCQHGGTTIVMTLRHCISFPLIANPIFIIYFFTVWPVHVY